MRLPIAHCGLRLVPRAACPPFGEAAGALAASCQWHTGGQWHTSALAASCQWHMGGPIGNRQSVIRNRRGSVLIMTVSLLVLMALIGTAWIATSRIDRSSSIQNVENTRIDLLVEGLRNITIGPIVDDILGRRLVAGLPTGSSLYRPRSDSATTYDYADTTSFVRDPAYPPLDKRNHPFLSPRTPEPEAGNIVWRAVGMPLLRGVWFESPLLGTRVDPANRYNVGVTSVLIAGRPAPALIINGLTLLAADTDGDGIADAGLWPLPVAQSNGVTYYAAYRVIDGNSAINAGIAWKPNTDYITPPTGLPGDFWPTNQNLQSLLAGGAAEMLDLNRFRFNNATASWNATPIDDNGASRTDFAWLSPYDLLWHNLGRRPGNPGWNYAGQKLQALSSGDMISLAYRFVLRNPTGSASTIETILPNSLLNAPGAPFAASDVMTWYSLFDYSANAYSRRALFVTANAVSNQLSPVIDAGPSGGLPDSVMPPYGSGAPGPKASLNTATWQELYRAVWSIMCGNAGGATFGTPFDADIAAQGPVYDPYFATKFDPATFVSMPAPQASRMFRSSLRDPRTPADVNTVRFEPRQMLLLRAALAAANMEYLRQPTNNIPSGDFANTTSRRLTLTAKVGNVDTYVNVALYGICRQPYITEVYVNNDVWTAYLGDATKKNVNGYIAIELHNPYDVPLSIAGYKVAILNRKPGGGYPGMTLTEIANLATGYTPANPTVIPARGYVLLENYRVDRTDANNARYRPQSTGLQQVDPAGAPLANTIYVRDLHRALDNEIVLLRPATENQTNQNVLNMAPVDSFDLTGLIMPDSGAADPLKNATAWHYARPSDRASGKAWKFVYPGRYDGSLAAKRHQGTQEATWNQPTAADPWIATPPIPGMSLLAGVAAGTPANPNGTYPGEFVVQIANKDVAGPNPAAAAGGNKFPFGTFARNGDVLHAPFIGAYRITSAATPTLILELNSVSMDSVFAEDTDLDDDPVEQIGRFCPIYAEVNNAPVVNDWGSDPARWRYQWARDVFDYLTVLAPHDDYLPNVARASYPSPLPAPVAVPNDTGFTVATANGGRENLVGVHGLINPNTAPWKIIATLPMAVRPDGTIDAAANDALAQAIVSYRNQFGPFRSFFDLHNVVGAAGQRFSNGWGTMTTGDADDLDGDVSPVGQGNADGARDFEEMFLVLNRISNMITLRSDSFTCYILVQGWRNAGTPNPQLVVQRRAAFLLDRTPVTLTNKSPRVTNVPQE